MSRVILGDGTLVRKMMTQFRLNLRQTNFPLRAGYFTTLFQSTLFLGVAIQTTLHSPTFISHIVFIMEFALVYLILFFTKCRKPLE